MSLRPYPKISIITVCYNSFSFLESTILNVLALDYPAIAIDYIIIDGGSTDGTIDIIKKYTSKLKYWISEPDGGIYDAMNKGWFKASDDSFILFLGAGDKILSLPDVESFRDTDVLFGDVQLGEKQLFRSKKNFMLKLGNTIHHQAELIRKSINITPPFLTKYKIYADFDFNQKLLLKGARFKKDQNFRSFALENGVSHIFNKVEPLTIVKSNYGFAYYILATLYYFYKNGKV